MLGISAGLNQKVITDFKEPTDYIEYLFKGIKGWICRGQIIQDYRQTMHRFNGLMQGQFVGESNVYISMNTFLKRTESRLPKAAKHPLCGYRLLQTKP